MKDLMLRGLLAEFSSSFGLADLDESEQFENFVNYCVMSNEKEGEYELDDVHKGGDGNYGIDGIAILVNDKVVTTTEEVDAVLARRKGATGKFLFIQSKTSDHFESGEMLKLFSAIHAFLRNETEFPFNDEVKALMSVKDAIIRNIVRFSEEPECKIYYATSGKWNSDCGLKAIVDAEVAKIESLSYFSGVVFFPLGAQEIKTAFKEVKHQIVRQIEFVRRATLPKIPNVEQAYIGVISASDFIHLISDDRGNILKSIFYDNVRDYQGENIVNNDMAATIKSDEKQQLFAILNNGITIVARDVKSMGDTFAIHNYQIVNGCQTSHVMHKHAASIREQVHVPVKIIVTNNEDVIASVIMATNSQTEVKREAFESLAPFHKELESLYPHYNSISGVELFYERRSKQYSESGFNRSQVISLAAQTKSYLAMFLDYPHAVHKYYGTFLIDHRDDLFRDTHDALPYYVAAYTYYKAEKFINRRNMHQFKMFKFYIMYSIRLILFGQSRYMNRKGANQPALQNFIKALQDDQFVNNYFYKICNILKESAISAGLVTFEAVRRKEFTELVRTRMLSER